MNLYETVKSEIMRGGPRGTTQTLLWHKLGPQGVSHRELMVVIGELDQQGLLVRDGAVIWWKEFYGSPVTNEQRAGVALATLEQAPLGLSRKDFQRALSNNKVVMGDAVLRETIRSLTISGYVVAVGEGKTRKYFHHRHAPTPAPSHDPGPLVLGNDAAPQEPKPKPVSPETYPKTMTAVERQRICRALTTQIQRLTDAAASLEEIRRQFE